jgi:putative N6-adenine-specific DNA methylase
MTESSERLRIFAVCAPGLEELLTRELRALGLPAESVQGGSEWEGDRKHLHLANLHSRLATRVLVRMAEFRARSFHELERHANRIAWNRFLPAGGSLHLRVSCRKSKLYHEGAVEERLLRAAEAQIPGISQRAGETDDDGEFQGEAQLIVVRFLHDRCTLSVDSSGAPLYMRGYRQAVGRAPLRETLAAAVLLGSGWRPGESLLDPMCGSGTIPIEAALISRNVAPGIASASRQPRNYAFERWPEHDPGSWNAAVEAAREAITVSSGSPIHASDRDEGAARATAENARRAGVLDDLTIECAALTSIMPPEAPGWLLSNPPYGLRVSESSELRNLYAALGRFARESLPGWHLGILSADSRLAAQLRLPLHEVLRTRNGGIPVSLLVTPSESNRDPVRPSAWQPD